MNLSALATNALATTRSTFKGLAEAAVASGDHAGADTAPGREVPPAKARAKATANARVEVEPAGQADATASKSKGVRRGTLLDAYA